MLLTRFGLAVIIGLTTSVAAASSASAAPSSTASASISSASSASACNGYDAFCSKAYTDLTYLGTHNSYAVGHAMADNQNYDVTYQLRDGVRLLQGQVHNKSDSNGNAALQLCHTNCALQDGGSLYSYLKKVKTFVKANPREVITMLWVNYDHLPAAYFDATYAAAGVDTLSYKHSGGAWPTLKQLIDAGTPIINFISSDADAKTYPYLHDEWAYIWETPYEVTDYRNFTCGLDRGSKPNTFYLANHFAYHESKVLSYTFDSPDTDNIAKTNSKSSVDAHMSLCLSSNSQYPNFVLVDQYDAASGGALQSIAGLNGVTYSRSSFGDGSANSIMTKIRTFFGGQHQVRNIAIVAVAGVVLLALITIGMCCFCIRQRRRNSRTEKSTSLSSFVGAVPFRPQPSYQPSTSFKAPYETKTDLSPSGDIKIPLVSTAPVTATPETSPTRQALLANGRTSPSPSPFRTRPTAGGGLGQGNAPLYEPTTARLDLRMNATSPYAAAANPAPRPATAHNNNNNTRDPSRRQYDRSGYGFGAENDRRAYSDRGGGGGGGREWDTSRGRPGGVPAGPRARPPASGRTDYDYGPRPQRHGPSHRDPYANYNSQPQPHPQNYSSRPPRSNAYNDGYTGNYYNGQAGGGGGRGGYY
ncbi:hypothetical protein PYCC9005_001244 [Savitreella phatthalungensis]